MPLILKEEEASFKNEITDKHTFVIFDGGHMFDLVPLILKEEEAHIKNDKHTSVIFDGTSRSGEALAVIVSFVGHWNSAADVVQVHGRPRNCKRAHKCPLSDVRGTVGAPPCFNEGSCISE